MTALPFSTGFLLVVDDCFSVIGTKAPKTVLAAESERKKRFAVALLPFPTFSSGFIDFYFVPEKQRKSVCCRMLHAHEKSCICILPLTYLYLTAL